MVRLKEWNRQIENTPSQVTEAVTAFCRSIRQDQEAEYVPVHTLPNAELRDCYGNVAKKVETSGGRLLYGWVIWLEPGKFLEAEHHAVWVAPDGHKECVSCHTHTDQILFVSDPEIVFNNDFIPNRRMALTDDARLLKWLELAEDHDRLKSKYAVKENLRANMARPDVAHLMSNSPFANDLYLGSRLLLKQVGQLSHCTWNQKSGIPEE
jgi:hypothetical protein